MELLFEVCINDKLMLYSLSKCDQLEEFGSCYGDTRFVDWLMYENSFESARAVFLVGERAGWAASYTMDDEPGL